MEMKKGNYFLILSIVSLCFANTFGQYDKTIKGLEFIDSLKQVKKIKSKHYHVYPDKYLFTDLNNNNRLEIIEIINKLEEDIPGFLPIELSQAFDFYQIYYYEERNNSYVKAGVSKFEFYNLERKSFYEVWLNQFKNPENLNKDLKEIVYANKELFINEITELIGLVDK